MVNSSYPIRRHANGALDLDHYRRRAQRLRRAALRLLVRALFRAVTGLPAHGRSLLAARIERSTPRASPAPAR